MSAKAHVTKKSRTANSPEATSRPRRTKRTSPSSDKVLPFSQLDAKHKALYLLDPVYRFERELKQRGFRIVAMRNVDAENVWEIELECPSNLRCRTSSEITNRLREIAEQADCPIPPGKLVAIIARRKVVAGFIAPPGAQPMKG